MKWKQAEFFFLSAATLLAATLFFDGSLDLKVLSRFYSPQDPAQPWPGQNFWLWHFFHRMAPWIIGVAVFASLAVVLKSQSHRLLAKWKIPAIYFLVVVFLGPGLVVNGLLKPNWGRPRPREVKEFAGTNDFKSYRQPTPKNGGRSFPCGHCSVGFTFSSLWFVLKSVSPALGVVTLLGSLVLGVLMSWGRLAAGAHFLSDAVTAALILWWLSYWTYYRLLQVPRWQAGERKFDHPLFLRGKKLLQKNFVRLGVIVGGIAVFTASLLVVTPFEEKTNLNNSQPTQNLDIHIDHATVHLTIDLNSADDFSVVGASKGFGFPWNRVYSACWERSHETACQISRKGIYVDFESVLTVVVNPSRIKKLKLKVLRGKVHYGDVSVLPEGYVILDESL